MGAQQAFGGEAKQAFGGEATAIMMVLIMLREQHKPRATPCTIIIGIG